MQNEHQKSLEPGVANIASTLNTDAAPPTTASHNGTRVLIGAREFMESLRQSSLAARKRLLVQAMTFEGDDAGRQLIQLMHESPAPDRRLCIDRYSDVVVNDRFVYPLNYLTDPALRQEVNTARTLLSRARASGIGVYHTNPTSPLLLRYPFRNHRKMAIADETVYLGGINFSDHNFAWHDMMIRLDDPVLAAQLSEAFDQNTRGLHTDGIHHTPTGTLFLTHRNRNPRIWKEIFACFENARSQILIISPYVTAPLLDVLRTRCRPEVKITIVSPMLNNKSLLKRYLMNESLRGYFDLRLMPGAMTHLKAALLDGETLLAGSSNFDFASYAFEEEVVLAIRDQAVVEEFRKKVAEPMITGSIPVPWISNKRITRLWQKKQAQYIPVGANTQHPANPTGTETHRNDTQHIPTPGLTDRLTSIPIQLISAALRLLS
jgi:cardiolipin synthase A/B